MCVGHHKEEINCAEPDWEGGGDALGLTSEVSMGGWRGGSLCAEKARESRLSREQLERRCGTCCWLIQVIVFPAPQCCRA